jgi:outer membrane autotransporter
LGAVKTDSLWVENSQDQVSIDDLTVNTELVLNAGELTVGNGKITGTGRVLEGSTLKVTNNLTLTGKSLTLNGTYESEGSLTLEKDSAVFIGGSFKADEVIANDLATMVLETKNFNANKVTLKDGEIRIRETANGVNVNSVSMDGSESRIQSWAGNATVKSVEAKGNSLIELYGLNDSSVAANLRIDQMALSDGANITLDNATKFDESSVAFGTVTLGKDSVLANVNNGISQLGIEQKALKKLTFESIEGNQATIVNDKGGQISIEEMTGSNNVVKVADTTADQIIIGNNASAGLTVTSSDSAYGNSMVSVDQGVADLAGTTVLGEDSTEGIKVVIGANDMTGRVEAVYDAKGNKISQTEEVNETNRTLTAIANLPVVAWRAELNDLYKRMGDLRATPYKSGAWVRYNGGKFKWSDGDLENDFHMIQVGIDTMPTENNIRFGTAFSYTKGDADFDGGSADLDTYSLALYGTWLGDKGQYVDVIGRVASIKNDANARSLTGQGKAYDGKMDNTGLSLSAEAGWRFALPYNLFIEPQVEATYSYIDSDSFRYGDRKYELQSTDSFIARAGFMAGIQCPDNKGNVYVRASVVHDFLGETDVKVSNAHMSRTVSNDFGGTWGEFGIGANVSVSDNTYVYADVEHTTGGEIEEPWRVNFGVRYNF